MTGLTLGQHRIKDITVCQDDTTKLITGLTSVWGIPSGEGWTDEKRLDILGKLGAVYEFNDGSWNEAQRIALNYYWYQEASQIQQEYYDRVDRDNDPKWKSTRQALFSDADTNGDNKLDYEEARQFLKKVRPLDYKTSTLDTRLERVDKHWYAASLMSSPSDSMTFADYEKLENLMGDWYAKGKLQATGWTDKVNGGDYLQSYCQTMSMENDDKVTYIYIKSSERGVESMQLQTSRIPETKMTVSLSNDNFYNFSEENWIKFNDAIDLAGFWGYENSDGTLAGLGFIGRDSKCTDRFRAATGSNYSWISPDPSKLAVKPEAPEEYKDKVDALIKLQNNPTAAVAFLDAVNGTVPSHEHDEKAETGLVVVTVLIWVAVVIMAGVFVFMCIKDRKKN